jgi:hypothetical protein
VSTLTSLMVHGIAPMRFHSTAAFSTDERHVRTLLTVFGARPAWSSRPFSFCTFSVVMAERGRAPQGAKCAR